MRRSLILFTGFLLVVVAVFALTGGDRPRTRVVPGGGELEPEFRAEPKINVAPVFVKPRVTTPDAGRLNPEWLNAAVQVRTVARGGGARGATGSPLSFSGVLVGDPRTVVTWLPSEPGPEMEVVFRDGTVRRGRLLGRDAASGLVALRLDEAASMALDWRDGPDLQVGDAVVAVGYESGIGAMRAHVALESEGSMQVLMLDRNVPNGWTGGGVLDAEGRVAGILLPYERARMTVGTPVLAGAELMWTVDALVQGLGVRRVDLGLVLGSRVSAPEGGRGWVVRQVEAGSLSAEAGVKPGDVLVAVNERELTHPGQLPYAAGAGEPGRPVSLELDSGGKRRTVLLPVGP